MELQLFVRVVDAKLLEPVNLEDLEAKDIENGCLPSIIVAN